MHFLLTPGIEKGQMETINGIYFEIFLKIKYKRKWPEYCCMIPVFLLNINIIIKIQI